MNLSNRLVLLAQDSDWHRWSGAGWSGWTWFWFAPFSGCATHSSGPARRLAHVASNSQTSRRESRPSS